MLARYGERATIVRPGKVAGPHDWQEGLTYWVRRAARGGPVAVPTDPAQPVQIIDSRDLARLVAALIADDRPGAFHAVGPAEPVTLGGLIQTCARVAGTQVEIVPVPAEHRHRILPAGPGQLAGTAAQPGQGPGRGHARHPARRHRGRRGGLGPRAWRAAARRRLHS